MHHEQFEVVLTGKFVGDHPPAKAICRFGRRFRLEDSQLKRAFSGREIVIKTGVTEAVGVKLMIEVYETGCECYLRELPSPDIEPFEEKRRGIDRRHRLRRPPRPGALIPDRRLYIRRRADRKYFLNTRKSGNLLLLSFSAYPPEAAD